MMKKNEGRSLSSIFDTFDVNDPLGANALEYGLSEKYPRPWRVSIRNNFFLIFSYLFLLFVCFYQMATSIGTSDGIFFDMLSYVTFNVLFGGLFLVASALFYEEYEHETYKYGLDSENLVVVKGVFLKKRSSFPINKISDLYLDRTWLDVIFFLYNLNFSTANDMSHDQGIISGLSRRSAVSIQELLTKIAAQGEISEKSEEALRGEPLEVRSFWNDDDDDDEEEEEDSKEEYYQDDGSSEDDMKSATRGR